MRAPHATSARAIALLLAIGLGAGGSSCGHAAPDPAPDPLAPLHAFEDARRAGADFAHLPPSDRSRGPDPYRIAALPAGSGAARYVGLLRGRDAVVLLDASLHEIDRQKTAASPSGLAVSTTGEVLVVGEQSPAIQRYFVKDARLQPRGAIEAHALTLRDVAVGPERVVYAVEAREGRLLTLAESGEIREIPAGMGAFRVARVGARVLVDCLLDHTLVAYDVDAQGFARAETAVTIHHDGPIWGFDALDDGGDLVVAAGGVEDHPLDRTGGSFGYVDSFVHVYRIARGARAAEKLAEINVSALGVVTPKALLLRAKDGGFEARVAGYGGDRLVTITLGSKGSTTPPVTRTAPLLPGVAALAAGDGDTLVAADPLLDAWLTIADGHVVAVPAEDPGEHPPSPTPVSRLGEALFFTTAMAPWNKSDGPLSRFTCETCHFEGHVDGRVHATGRGDIVAVTKPLLGLFNNRPHFSRALDPDLTSVASNEFRVAGANSGHDPWFAAAVAEQPWLRDLGVPASELDPASLRVALMTFLMDFTPRPNPMALDHAAFSPAERAGAEVFARRCEGCHAARLSADVPTSRVAPAEWERLVLSREGPIVWGSNEYQKTGVEPYVHPSGARVPSLRRLYAKRPYFTNGAARTLRDVLDRARFQGANGFFHDRAPEGSGATEALSYQEREALLAFLALL
ncbi:MAG: hypothetical protein ABJE95_23250 [Byssovorax sp.]